jgi:hypothetical protein
LTTQEANAPGSGITAYQAKYLAYDLTRRYPSNSYERFGESLSNAQVDLNPHQVEVDIIIKVTQVLSSKVTHPS